MRYVSARPDQELTPHKSLLYGEDYTRHAVVICEGPTDAWRIGPGAVATMGLSVTLSQVYRMSRFPVRVICFDNESEARRRADRLAKQLQPLPGETYVAWIETGKDVAEADPAEVVELRRRFLGA
jgi:DNA primase